MARVICEYPSRAHRDGVAKWRVVFKRGGYYLDFIRGLAWPNERVTSRGSISEASAKAHWSYARKLRADGFKDSAKAAKWPPWREPKSSQTGSE